jgi:hypothetical protein
MVETGLVHMTMSARGTHGIMAKMTFAVQDSVC